ncbi:hypothetical protein AX15_006425 [Amanita polypyramis BW_CC]|nr:hypothetical protein AX15_006425 [Amanita polypyramis BW_CC]
MSSAATAIANAVTKPNPIPPSSPFAELLRRSRFASYDPAIRQTYSSPAAHAHRGDWGLKRPITLRRRNAFISLSSFESPAQFTEWNHAENQVRFIRRIEEMGVTPRVASESIWYRGLGKAKTEWLVDSEFCPGESHVLKSGQPTPIGTDLPGLGNRGRGQYGANRPHQRSETQGSTQVIPNWDAMSIKDFQRYIRKLRALRPKFQQYLRAQDNLTEKSPYEVAQDSTTDHHIRFLLSHTTQEFQDQTSRQIEQQPHFNAGLAYAHPSHLTTNFMIEAQPGIVLQANNEQHFHRYSAGSQEKYIASFGGLAATVIKKNAGGKVPIFNSESEQGIDKSKLNNSVGYMRVKSLELGTPPRVVGRGAQGIRGVKLRTEVVVKSSHHEFRIENPHEPGTPEYVAVEKGSMPSRPSDFTRRPVNYTYDLKKLQHSAVRPYEATKVLTTLRDSVSVDRNTGNGRK